MQKIIQLAALCLSAAVFVGCDNKDNSATTAPPASPSGMTTSAVPATPPAPTAPAMPDVSKTTTAVDNAVDKGASAAKTEADKLMSNAPTTMPSMPSMPK